MLRCVRMTVSTGRAAALPSMVEKQLWAGSGCGGFRPVFTVSTFHPSSRGHIAVCDSSGLQCVAANAIFRICFDVPWR